jgi:hypothetical protein
VALVASALPRLSERERVALALVGLAGRPRQAAADRLGAGPAELSELLARARKELRRTLAPLPGSGWCERAERLISDRADGALTEADAPRLGVHLRNCPRCVEHERRLVQATDALLERAAPAPPPPMLVAPAAEPQPAALTVAAPAATTPAATEPLRDVDPAEPAGLAPALVLAQLARIVGWSVLMALGVLLLVGTAVLGADVLGVQL